MYIYHLYLMLQGLAALYFVAVTAPSVALDLYTSYSFATVLTSFTAPSTSASSTAVIAHRDTNEHSIYIPECSIAQLDDSDYAQSTNISLLPTFNPQSLLPPAALEQSQDGAVYFATHQYSSVPLEAITMQGSSSTFSSSFCLLALGMVLGALGTCRFLRSSIQQPRNDGNMDRTNSDWLRQALPESIAEREILEDCESESRFASQTDMFGLCPRPRGSDIFSDFAVPSSPTAVPSRVIAQSTRTSKRTKDVMNPQATDLLESYKCPNTPYIPLSTAQPIAVLYGDASNQTSSTPAKGQKMNFKTTTESKPSSINVPNDSQSTKQSTFLPWRKQFTLVQNFGPSILVTPPSGRMVSREHNTQIESVPDETKRVGVCDISKGAINNEKPTTTVVMRPAMTSPADLCTTVAIPLKGLEIDNSDLRVGSIMPESSLLTPARPVHDPEHLEQSSTALHVNIFDTSSSESSLGPITPEIPIRQLRHGTPAMIASTNPHVGQVLKEFDYYYNDQKGFDKSLDTLGPTRLMKCSGSFGSFPGLFASPHASASELVTLIATPMTFPPWKFDELIPPATPLKNTPPIPDNRTEIALGVSRPSGSKSTSIPFTGNEEPSPHLDTQNEPRLKEIKGKFEWDDKAFDEQVLRWRSHTLPKPLEVERDFWTQFESNTLNDSDRSSCWWTPNESTS